MDPSFTKAITSSETSRYCFILYALAIGVLILLCLRFRIIAQNGHCPNNMLWQGAKKKILSCKHKLIHMYLPKTICIKDM